LNPFALANPQNIRVVAIMSQASISLLLLTIATGFYGCTNGVYAGEGEGTQGTAAPVKGICNAVDSEARITPQQLSKLEYLSKGNSTNAMRHLVGLPYCWVGQTEYFPLTTDPATWIGIMYDANGTYQGYTYSVNNNRALP
jgi:hypothetical protein